MYPEDYVSNGMFWCTLALINAGLAQAKNRNGLHWFLLSLLFGPLATLGIVLPSREDNAKKKTPAASTVPEQ